jgi:hypothetical protein
MAIPTRSNLCVQCNPYQKSNDILQELENSILIYMETQKNSNSQNNSEQNPMLESSKYPTSNGTAEP